MTPVLTMCNDSNTHVLYYILEVDPETKVEQGSQRGPPNFQVRWLSCQHILKITSGDPRGLWMEHRP